jgi:hypothetical protein
LLWVNKRLLCPTEKVVALALQLRGVPLEHMQPAAWMQPINCADGTKQKHYRSTTSACIFLALDNVI